MTIISVFSKSVELAPHWYDPHDGNVKEDRFGKKGGYRVHPSGPGGNQSDNAVFYRSLDDIAEHLRARPDWGLRFTTPSGSADIFYDNIMINGKPR